MKMFVAVLVLTAVSVLSGCTRIETGEVGVRIDASKQVQGRELLPGSFNQTIVGDVLTFPVKDIVVSLTNKTPLTADNSALADFDVTVVYNVNPSAVAELYSTKSKSFHATMQDGDVLLMYTFVSTLINNAVYKAVRQYKALEVADNRTSIEQQIKEEVTRTLKDEKLDSSLSISIVQIRNVTPNADILRSATEYVRAQNELKVKETQVQIAKMEAERMAALANNSQQSIAYMQAQAQLNISEAVKMGKVQTIIIPSNLTMLGNIK